MGQQPRSDANDAYCRRARIPQNRGAQSFHMKGSFMEEDEEHAHAHPDRYF